MDGFAEGLKVGMDIAGLQANMRNVADEIARINNVLMQLEQRVKRLESEKKEK